MDRRAVSAAATVLLVVGAGLVLGGFAIAHLCNADINLFQLCLHPRSGEMICHRIGPVLLLLGLLGHLAMRRPRPGG